jgi:hypothetical protein
MEKTVRALAKKLKFVPVAKTPYFNGPEFKMVAFNDEFVLFSNGSVIEWVSMNGHYDGRFEMGV